MEKLIQEIIENEDFSDGLPKYFKMYMTETGDGNAKVRLVKDLDACKEHEAMSINESNKVSKVRLSAPIFDEEGNFIFARNKKSERFKGKDLVALLVVLGFVQLFMR